MGVVALGKKSRTLEYEPINSALKCYYTENILSYIFPQLWTELLHGKKQEGS